MSLPRIPFPSHASHLALQRTIGNQRATRLRNRLLTTRSVVQRHGDRELQEQIEEAKRREESEESGAPVQRTFDPAAPGARSIQRHLIPKASQAEDYDPLAVPTAEMAERARQAIADRVEPSRNAILQWLDQQNIEQSLKDQKVKQAKALEWKTTLQRLGGVPAKVDGTTGIIQLFTRTSDYFDKDGNVDEEFLQVTMIHEGFHALSAGHTGFQGIESGEVDIKESMDEAFTEKFAAEAFHLAFGQGASYASNYWLPKNNRWTGDFAEVVEQLSGLSKDQVIDSYLQHPDVVSNAYAQNLLVIQEAWTTLKGQPRPKSEPDAQQQIATAVTQAQGKGLVAPQPAAGPAAAPQGGQPHGAPQAAPAAAPAAANPELEAIFQFMSKLPTNRGMPKTMGVKPQLQTMVDTYNLTRPEKDHIQVMDLGTLYMKWKEATEVTAVNEGHLKTAAETLGLPTSDHSGINLVIPTTKTTLSDMISSVPSPQRTKSASLEHGQATFGQVMGEPGGDQSQKAAELLDAMGGGGYEASSATIFLHPKHNNNLPHYVHEVGHYVQHGEQGFFQKAKGGDNKELVLTTVLDYHNIIKNENPHHLTEESKLGKKDDERRIRYKYVGSEKDIMGPIEELETKGETLPLSAELLEQLQERPYCTDIDRAMLDEMFMLMINNRDVYPASVRSLIFSNLGIEWAAEAAKKGGP